MQGLIKDIKRLRDCWESHWEAGGFSLRAEQENQEKASCSLGLAPNTRQWRSTPEGGAGALRGPPGRCRKIQALCIWGWGELIAILLHSITHSMSFTHNDQHSIKKKKKWWYAWESKKTHCQESTVNWWKPRYGTDRKWSDWDFKVTIPIGQQQQSSKYQ